MKYALICGSHRTDAQSYKVAKWLGKHLSDREHEVEIIHLGQKGYPMWDETSWDENSAIARLMYEELKPVAAADGIILISPEWSGMVPAALKNYILYLNQKHVGHKPTLLVGVSSGRGGSYPIAELRMSSYKNTRLLYLPEHLIVQDVKNVMNVHDTRVGEEADVYIKERALYALDHLEIYAHAMSSARKNDLLYDERYPNGM